MSEDIYAELAQSDGEIELPESQVESESFTIKSKDDEDLAPALINVQIQQLTEKVDFLVHSAQLADNKLDAIGVTVSWLAQVFAGIQQSAGSMNGPMGAMVRKMMGG